MKVHTTTTWFYVGPRDQRGREPQGRQDHQVTARVRKMEETDGSHCSVQDEPSKAATDGSHCAVQDEPSKAAMPSEGQQEMYG